MKSTELANAVNKYRGKKFALGDTSKGFDCLNSLMDFYSGFGYVFPEEIEGINGSNYPEVWATENGRARAVFEAFLLGLGDPVGLHFSIRGDLLVFKGDRLPAFPAIALGNGNMMMVGTEGVRIEPVSRYKPYLIGVRRLIK